MKRRLHFFLTVLLSAAAGFFTVRLLNNGTSSTASTHGPSTRAKTVPFKPPWLALKGSARLTSCMESLASISPADWPAVFARQQHDELLRPLLVRGWSEADPVGFWNWLKPQKNAALIREFGPAIFSSWARRDPQAAFAAAASIAIVDLRDSLRCRVVETVLASDLSAGFALAAKLGPLRTGGGDSSWIAMDPGAAVRGLAELPKGSGFFRYNMHTALPAWAKQDPDATLAWLSKGQELCEGGAAWPIEVFKGLAAKDPRKALAAAAAIPNGFARDHPLSGAISGAALVLPVPEIIAWADRISGAIRNDALGYAIKALAPQDPARAAELLAASSPSSAALRSTSRLASQWAKTDWSAARAWVDTLPDSPMRRVAWKELSANLNTSNTAGMATTAAMLPFSELSDGLLQNVRHALTKQGPAAADAWLSSLPADRAAWAKSLSVQ